jgi:hypothetical protein
MTRMPSVVATYLAQISMGDAWRIGVREEERTRFVTASPRTAGTAHPAGVLGGRMLGASLGACCAG